MSDARGRSVLQEINELVTACYPQSQEEALALWHDIKPVRFGRDVTWTIADEYILAFFGIPDDVPYLVVTRVESYVTTNVATAAGFGEKGPPPPGSPTFGTRWVQSPSFVFPAPDLFNVTGATTPHILLDVDEFLFFKGGNDIQLLAFLAANPTADARRINTLVYGYLLGPSVADKLGSGEILIVNI